MNLAEMREIEELPISHQSAFTKFRILSLNNAFPSLFITSIERLIIKRHFSFAFEVFFGIMSEIQELQELQIDMAHKKLLADFTCMMQAKKLKAFRDLQQEENFYSVINHIGHFVEFDTMEETIEYLRDLFKKVKISVKVRNKIPSKRVKNSELTYARITICKLQGEFYLMYEINDYMDEDAMKIEEEELQKKLEDERIFREEQVRKEKEKIEKALNDNIQLMRFEENQVNFFLKCESQSRANQYEKMKFEDYFLISYKKIEYLASEKAEDIMKTQEFYQAKFDKTEADIKKKELETMKKFEGLSIKDEKYMKKNKIPERRSIGFEDAYGKNFIKTERFLQGRNSLGISDLRDDSQDSERIEKGLQVLEADKINNELEYMNILR